jgi:hypothetical protein
VRRSTNLLLASAILMLVAWSALASLRSHQELLLSLQRRAGAPPDVAAQRIVANRSRNERVAIWGYAPALFVDSQSIMGTRDSISQFAILGGDYRPYYRARFLADLEKNHPALFVDSTGPLDFAFKDRSLYGYETFPALAAYVDRHYNRIPDSWESDIRIFRLRDDRS